MVCCIFESTREGWYTACLFLFKSYLVTRFVIQYSWFMSFNKLKTLVQKGDNRQHTEKWLCTCFWHLHTSTIERRTENCRCTLNRNLRKCKRYSTCGIVTWPESVSKMADEGTSTRRKGRKRLRFESEWVRKKRKTEKDSGEAYTTYKGDPKPQVFLRGH